MDLIVVRTNDAGDKPNLGRYTDQAVDTTGLGWWYTRDFHLCDGGTVGASRVLFGWCSQEAQDALQEDLGPSAVLPPQAVSGQVRAALRQSGVKLARRAGTLEELGLVPVTVPSGVEALDLVAPDVPLEEIELV